MRTTRRFCLTLVLLPLLAVAGRHAVWGVTCEAPAGTPPGTRPTYAWQDHFTALTRLGNHWMPTFGDGDSMSRPFWHDQGTSFPFGSAGLQESWYLARDAIPNTAAFYSLLYGGQADHMDSPYSSEGSYVLDLGIPHGFAWLSDFGGMKPLRRYYKSSINDHRTWLYSSTPPGYSIGATYSTMTSTPRYGYERYGNLLDQCSVINLANSIGVKMQDSKLRVGFDPIWGNAISEVTDLATGKQIVSHSIGDMLQSVLWYGGPDGQHLLNPTQSGGTDCWDYGNTRRWAGSPVISTTPVTGTGPKSMTTTVRPLNFCHDDFQGNDVWSPLAWRGLFRITTTLGCKLGGVLYDDVIEVKHEAKKDADAPFTDNPINMNNGGWFLPGPFGDCNLGTTHVDEVDMTSGAIVSTHPLTCNTQYLYPGVSNRALRIVSGDGTFALGFGHLGSVVRFDVNFSCNFDCSTAHQKLILGVHKFHNLSTTTWESEDIFYVVGTPANVLARLASIWKDGGNCST